MLRPAKELLYGAGYLHLTLVINSLSVCGYIPLIADTIVYHTIDCSIPLTADTTGCSIPLLADTTDSQFKHGCFG